MACGCSIVPEWALARLARDPRLGADQRANLLRTLEKKRSLREARAARMQINFVPQGGVPPPVAVYDCKNTDVWPFTLVPRAAHSPDIAAKRAFIYTAKALYFLQKRFNRNSIDGSGMTVRSGVHFYVKYSGASWDGTQILYGDGDGSLFLDFTLGLDVIGHEITHGLTHYSAEFDYVDEAGALNESMSTYSGRCSGNGCSISR